VSCSLARPQQALHDASELIAIQLLSAGSGSTQLMHPVIGQGRTLAPVRLRAERHVDVPGWDPFSETEDLRIGVAEACVAVVIVRGPAILQAVSFATGGGLGVAEREYRQPHHVGPKGGVQSLGEHLFLDYGDPP